MNNPNTPWRQGSYKDLNKNMTPAMVYTIQERADRKHELYDQKYFSGAPRMVIKSKKSKRILSFMQKYSLGLQTNVPKMVLRRFFGDKARTTLKSLTWYGCITETSDAHAFKVLDWHEYS